MGGMAGISLIGYANPKAFWQIAQKNDPLFNGTDWAKQMLQFHPDMFARLVKDIRNQPDGEGKRKDLSTLEEVFNQLPKDTQQDLISKLNESDAHDQQLNQMDQYLGQEAGIGASPGFGFLPTAGADSFSSTYNLGQF